MAGLRALGKAGEDAAASHLEEKGYRILRRNFRTRSGEIDLVARDGQTIVFVEVKARTGTRFGLPAEAVGRARIERLERAGQLFLREIGGADLPYRIDVVSVLVSETGEPRHVEHLANVTL